jgi:peroxiredoxin
MKGSLRAAAAIAGVALASGCGGSHPPGFTAAAASVPDVPLLDASGEAVATRALLQRSPLTVLVFYSPDCHVLAVHEDRLRALYESDGRRGVQIVMVDSEAGASPARDALEARRRGYPFPILVDPGARLADALGADYAAYAVVTDPGAHVHYHGGIDSDRIHLHDDRTPYLELALEDLLAHREPRIAEGKSLGCALQKW